MKALFLGSIGVLAETSELQRNAFNTAFAEAGLDWHWSQQTYAKLLKTAGGADRIAQEAARRGQKVDAAALHRRKSALFQERLQAGVPLRPGIAATLGAARDAGHMIALVTSTSAANVAALLGATGLAADSFDLVLTRNDAPATKPDPGIYHAALGRLGVAPDAVCAVEDNPDGLAAARAAGLTCVGFPGALHDDADFQQAAIVLSTLSLDAISAAAG
jgi:HAD superfamily hydrolase (TIGR01509 family)